MDAWYAQLPRKRVGTGVLLLNQSGALLIVKPVYRPHWSIPGGIVDENEPPWLACQREIREELGFECPELRLLCLSWCVSPAKGESLQFLYGGPCLTSEQQAGLRLDPVELSELRWLAPELALPLLVEPLRLRVRQGLLALTRGGVYELDQRQEHEGQDWYTLIRPTGNAP